MRASLSITVPRNRVSKSNSPTKTRTDRTVNSSQREQQHIPRTLPAYSAAALHSPTDRVHQSRCAEHARQGSPAIQPCALRGRASYLPYENFMCQTRTKRKEEG